MEELSWQARLARSNINILGIDKDRWYYEFMYHPHQGSTKWCKTFYAIDGTERYPDGIAERLLEQALSLRKELER